MAIGRSFFFHTFDSKSGSMKTVTEHLLALADAGNAAFTARLVPGVDPDRMLGCRIPQLHRLARTLRGTPEAAAFLTQLPHRYYDENNLHGILLGHIRPTGEALDALERFLPHIDNWATCDITAWRHEDARPRPCGGPAPHLRMAREPAHLYRPVRGRRPAGTLPRRKILRHAPPRPADLLPAERVLRRHGRGMGFQRGARQAFRANAALLHPTAARPPVHNKALQKGRESSASTTPAKRSCNVSNTDLPCPMETNQPGLHGDADAPRHPPHGRPSAHLQKRLSVFTTHSV